MDEEQEFFVRRVQTAMKIKDARAKCNGKCWECWISVNARECVDVYQRALDILDELPWKVE